jgi:hypothetical protein
MPIKAAEEQRMQLTRRSRVLRSSKNMPRLVGIFAGDVAERDAREPRCEFLRQDGGHSLSLLSVCKRMSRLAVRRQLATLSFRFRGFPIRVTRGLISGRSRLEKAGYAIGGDCDWVGSSTTERRQIASPAFSVRHAPAVRGLRYAGCTGPVEALQANRHLAGDHSGVDMGARQQPAKAMRLFWCRWL